nr:hypothetical protein [Actinomycetota bacterium]
MSGQHSPGSNSSRAKHAAPHRVVRAGRSKATVAGVRRRRAVLDSVLAAVAAIVTMMSGVSLVLFASVSTAGAAAPTPPISTVSKTGVDTTTNSKVDSSAPAALGTTKAGDQINWTLNYANTSAQVASATLSDTLDPSLRLKGGVTVPPGFSTSVTGQTIKVSGPTTVASTGAFGNVAAQQATVAKDSQGDGFDPLFYNGNVYAINHHESAQTNYFFCHQILDPTVPCPGFPTNGGNAWIDPGARGGVPFGAGSPANNTALTSIEPGAVISGSKMYVPVQIGDNPVGNPIGMLCADLAINKSCGFTQFGTAAKTSPAGYGHLIGDGVLAADGNTYYEDSNFTLYCFNPKLAAVCGSHTVAPANVTITKPGNGRDLSVTFGRYVFGSEFLFTSAHQGGAVTATCFDVVAQANCANFPMQDFVTTSNIVVLNIDPVLDASGNVTGACYEQTSQFPSKWFGMRCFSTSGAAIANPYPDPSQKAGNPTYGFNGLNVPLVQGSRVYVAEVTTDRYNNSTYDCFDFAARRLNPAVVASCNNYIPQIYTSSRDYTIRPDPSDPTCLWALGDAGLFDQFSAPDGGFCTTYTASASTTPSQFYCDGNSSTHVKSWGKVQLVGVDP